MQKQWNLKEVGDRGPILPSRLDAKIRPPLTSMMPDLLTECVDVMPDFSTYLKY